MEIKTHHIGNTKTAEVISDDIIIGFRSGWVGSFGEYLLSGFR
ncbi:hypothetical protein [Chryseobacterium wanjuense]